MSPTSVGVRSVPLRVSFRYSREGGREGGTAVQPQPLPPPPPPPPPFSLHESHINGGGGGGDPRGVRGAPIFSPFFPPSFSAVLHPKPAFSHPPTLSFWLLAGKLDPPSNPKGALPLPSRKQL